MHSLLLFLVIVVKVFVVWECMFEGLSKNDVSPSASLSMKGDTRQNIKKDLECLMKTGEFIFQANASDGYTIRLTLQFEASSSDSSPDPHIHHAFHVEWNSEQISSFLTQLGFHDHGEDPEMDQQIDTFLHINEVYILDVLVGMCSMVWCLSFSVSVFLHLHMHCSYIIPIVTGKSLHTALIATVLG